MLAWGSSAMEKKGQTQKSRSSFRTDLWNE